MSTATKFAFLGAFPICPAASAAIDAVTPGYFTWARNLTLAQVMDFYWNVENFTLTTTGAVSGTWPAAGGHSYAGNAVGTMTLNPLGTTGDWKAQTFSGDYDAGSGGVTGWKKSNSGGSVPLAGGATAPRDRVCMFPYFYPYCLRLFGQAPAPDYYTNCGFEFLVAEDSVNAGRYAIGYTVAVKFGVYDLTAGGVVFSMTFSSRSGGHLSSGTYAIGGVTFDYYFGTDLPAASAGFSAAGTLSATSSNYTY